MPEAPTLRPRPGFDWTLVSWGGPKEPQADTCSYCDAPIDDYDVPLILWKDDGSCARFCDNCQRRWWGIETFNDLGDDYEEDPAPPDDPPSLGPCCICDAETGARTIVILPVKGVIPGHGWGCFVCGLPSDGASAVLCGTCVEDYAAGRQSHPATEGRIAAEALTEPHVHDPSVEHWK